MFRKKQRIQSNPDSPAPPDPAPATTTTVAAHSIEFATRHFEPVRRSSTGETIVQSQSNIEVSVYHANSSESLRRLQMNNAAGDSDPKSSESKETKETKEPGEPEAEPKDLEEPKDTEEPSKSRTWYSWAWSRKPDQRRSRDQPGQQESGQQTNDDSSGPDDAITMGKDKEGGSWAFWSKKNRTGGKDEGELAITGTDTANHPRQATFVEHKPIKASKKGRPSLVIPAYMSSLEWQTSRTRLFSSLAKWGLGNNQKVYRTSPPALKRVVVVGIHGYFPARMTRAILGEPTGTSIKFANEAAAELEKWAAQHNYSLEIEKIALEGEGKIDHRVSSLYLLLLNWQDHIQAADLVFFAAHSQGTVVTTHLISRLYKDGLLKTSQHVGFLGMAGTCLGPMPGMDQTLVGRAITRIENDSLQELFELQSPKSRLGAAYLEALVFILQRGVKLTLVGATDDQLVPLYSALCIHVNHPNLLRCAYLDGDDVAPEVIAPLLDLALTSLNRGQSDAGVVVEVSTALAGALTGKGHSKLYSHPQVYRLGIESALETSPTVSVDPVVDYDFVIPRSNPYLLPWALHELVVQVGTQPEYQAALEQLRTEFDAWRPEVKSLKDLKYRMSALKRAKL